MALCRWYRFDVNWSVIHFVGREVNVSLQDFDEDGYRYYKNHLMHFVKGDLGITHGRKKISNEMVCQMVCGIPTRQNITMK